MILVKENGKEYQNSVVCQVASYIAMFYLSGIVIAEFEPPL